MLREPLLRCISRPHLPLCFTKAHLFQEPCRVFRSPLLGREVNVGYPKASSVAVSPFEIVQET